MNAFVMLDEGDLIAVSEIKRIRNRADGKCDVWLKGESEYHVSKMSFGQFVNAVEWCHQNGYVPNSPPIELRPYPGDDETVMNREPSLTISRKPPPPIPRTNRHFPPADGDE